MAIEVLFLVS